MPARAPSLLEELESLSGRFGGIVGARKLELVRALEKERLSQASLVLRLHEVLCFLRAHPDDAALLGAVQDALAHFDERADLRRQRRALEGSGVAGTEVRFRFFAPTARWLARRFPGELAIDWADYPEAELLAARLHLLAVEAESPGLDVERASPRAWIERLKRPDEGDAAFLLRRLGALAMDPAVRDAFQDELDLPLILRPGPGTPSRTGARLPGGRVVFQQRPLRRDRPELVRALREPPRSIRSVPRREARAIVDLAREAMAVRARDLDAFAAGDPDDVRLVDCGDGLEFAVIGVQPADRMLLDAVYGWLTLQNRVPIGYVLTSALFRSSEIAYNVFDTWRGGEAGHVYGRVLATTRALFGSETFTIYPYQLGHGNPEGIESGAWWFYQKLGFRPRDPAVLALMERELARMRRDPAHRSSAATLERLARANVYYERGRRRAQVIGTFPFARIGAAVTDYLAERFGADRERGQGICADEVAPLVGLGGWRRLPRHERRAVEWWGPLLRLLPGLEGWGRRDRLALGRVVRAKGGRRESDYVRLFDGHPRLSRALARLARTAPEGGA